MFALAINQTAGVGVGLFVGCLIGLYAHKASGKEQRFLVRESILFTALLAGMLGWIAAAVFKLILG